jgi:hypothetical protein
LTKDLNVYDLFRPVYTTTALLTDESRIGEVEIGGEKRTYVRGHTA